jgi:GTP-binding protein
MPARPTRRCARSSAAYGADLDEKPEIVALSKVDALSPEARKEQLARLKRACGRTPIALSAASGEGVEAALRAVFAIVEEARAQEAKDEAPAKETGWHP